MSERMFCPDCGSPCERDEVDIGVGNIYGPWSCFDCGWKQPEQTFPEMKSFEAFDDHDPFANLGAATPTPSIEQAKKPNPQTERGTETP